MSQTTRCPACQTLFKVVPDQLRVSEGWVRCGQCSEIFDAALHLYQEPQIASEVHGIEASSARVAEVAIKPEDPPEPAVLVAMPAQVDIELGQDLAAQQSGMAEPVQSVDAPNPSTQVPVPDPTPPVSFLREAQQRSGWQRPWVRLVLGLACVSLLAGLALQVLVHERDRIAATMPDARPAMVGICALVHCRISPLRQIESVVIDSSTFTKLRGDAYRLAFTVKNTSAIELALPALELTLTDSQDQAALRRVFLPSEFGATSNALSAGSEWVASAPVGVRPGPGVERITGYRILAFYP